MSDRDRLAAVVLAHPDKMDGTCCGGQQFETQQEWALHVADALIAAGAAMPEEVERLRELVKVNFDLYSEAMAELRKARDELALLAAGVTMPAPRKEETRSLCWCGESAESTGWGVCEKHFDVDTCRCNKPLGDLGRFCILVSGHDGKCY